MTAQRAGPEWELIRCTRRGAAHLRTGQPNQDALSWFLAGGPDGQAACLAAADGHGSKRNFRSDRGAKFAVEVAREQLREFAGGFAHTASDSEANKVATIDLPDRIGRVWAERVGADVDHRRFTPEELAALSPAERGSVTSNPRVPYGATLLGVLLTPRFAVYLQLGDGDILVVDREGGVTRPLPPDERSFANETASLCSGAGPGRGRRPGAGDGGWADFRVRFVPHSPDGAPLPPALVLVSTDGYPNSFRSDADFIQVGTDLLAQLRSGGVDDLRRNLPEWLDEASRLGSGDDMTVGLIVGPAAYPAPHADGPPTGPPDPLRAEPCPSGPQPPAPAASPPPAAPVAELARPWWQVWYSSG